MFRIGADDKLAKQLFCRRRIETWINPIRIDWARRGVGVPLQGPRVSGHGGLPSFVIRHPAWLAWMKPWAIIPKQLRPDATGHSADITRSGTCSASSLPYYCKIHDSPDADR